MLSLTLEVSNCFLILHGLMSASPSKCAVHTLTHHIFATIPCQRICTSYTTYCLGLCSQLVLSLFKLLTNIQSTVWTECTFTRLIGAECFLATNYPELGITATCHPHIINCSGPTISFLCHPCLWCLPFCLWHK